MNLLERRLSCLVLVAASAPPASALAPASSSLQEKAVRHPGLGVPGQERPVAEMGDRASRLRDELRGLGAGPDGGFFDWRSDRWGSLVVAVPLLPGSGAGNGLAWEGAAPRDDAELQQRAWDALRGYLRTHASSLGVDLTELPAVRAGVFDGGSLIQLHAARVVHGVPVRGSGVSAVINHGNLVLLGIERWASVGVATSPATNADEARARVAGHLQPFRVARYREQPRLEIVALAQGDDAAAGKGYDYRLAWVLTPEVAGDLGSWEALVDAKTGELLAFEDRNQYAVRRVVGGVYPFSNDQVPPDGVEQPGWPMPFTNAVAGPPVFTSTGGIVPGCVQGSVQTTLNGQFLRVQDNCGPINETSAGDIDLGTSGGTDCVVPPGHSAGDTHAARTSYYELSRIQEQARAYLPGNAWLQGQLTASVNLTGTCNALWNGTSLQFYQEAGGCTNTGEIASVMDHEWGHGLDDNGVDGSISNPAESIADVYTILRQDNSCMGRNLFNGTICGGYGDACDTCTGRRELDWLQHRCDRPHGIEWILNGFTDAECHNTGPAPACPIAGNPGPCGRLQFCESVVASEAAWDLQFRDLRAAPFNYDSNTALELTTRLMYLAPQTLTSWYTCGAGCAASGTCGCGATGGYLLTLAADDDDGNIANGTPHMSAIRAAFERHEIHCATPVVSDAGCAGGPTGAPVLGASAAPQGVSLSWTPVAGADHYDVYRAEGLFACDAGKVKAGQATGTTFLDPDLLDSRSYSYVVLPVGANSSCFGLMSNCASSTPAAGADPCGALVQVSFTQAASSAAEDAGTTPLTVVLTTPDGLPTTAPVTVDFATADGTAAAGSDYTGMAGTLSFPAGTPDDAVATIDVALLDDATDELDETFSGGLTNPVGGILGGIATQTVTVIDNDPAPLLAISDTSVREGDNGTTAAATFTLNLDNPSSQTVTVSFTTADGTAGAGTDYVAASGALTFPAGSDSATMTVTVNGDDIREGDESFLVNLTNPTNATLDDAQGLGLVVDDDSWPELTHGQAVVASLRAQPGPVADADVYRLSQKAFSSYEVVVDAATGDLGPSGVDLDLLASDGVIVLQSSLPVGTGFSRSLRFENATAGSVDGELVRVRAPGCAASCGPNDVYRIRLYDTTASLARFNNSATQITVLALQNLSGDAVAGNVRFWSPGGAPLASLPFSLVPHGTLVANTSAIAGLAGQSGSVTIGNDGVYGALAGKAVAVEPATGFTFDSPLTLRPR